LSQNSSIDPFCELLLKQQWIKNKWGKYAFVAEPVLYHCFPGIDEVGFSYEQIILFQGLNPTLPTALFIQNC